MYEICEVGGLDNQATIERFNSLDPITFPALTLEHLINGYWWLAYLNDDPVAFAGMVPMAPFPGVGFETKIWAETVLRLPTEEAKRLVGRNLAARADALTG